MIRWKVPVYIPQSSSLKMKNSMAASGPDAPIMACAINLAIATICRWSFELNGKITSGYSGVGGRRTSYGPRKAW